MALYTSRPGDAIASPQRKQAAKQNDFGYDDATLLAIYNKARSLKQAELTAKQQYESLQTELAEEQGALTALSGQYNETAKLSAMSIEDRGAAIAAAEKDAKESAARRNKLNKELAAKRKATEAANKACKGLTEDDPDYKRLQQELRECKDAEKAAKSAYKEADADNKAAHARLAVMDTFRSGREADVTARMDEIRANDELCEQIRAEAADLCDKIAHDASMDYPNYSENNMKILNDRGCTRAAGKDFWKKHGYTVRDDAAGIEINAPEVDKDGNFVKDENGKQCFVHTTVYDISDTDAMDRLFDDLLRQRAENMVQESGIIDIKSLEDQIADKQQKVQDMTVRKDDLAAAVQIASDEFTTFCQEHASELEEIRRRGLVPSNQKKQERQSTMENQNVQNDVVDIKKAVSTATDTERLKTFREKFRDSQFMQGLTATGRGLAQMLYFDKIGSAVKSTATRVHESISDKIDRMKTSMADFKESIKNKVTSFKNGFAERFAKKSAERDVESGEAESRSKKMRDFLGKRKNSPDVDFASGGFYQTMNKFLDVYQSVIDSPDMTGAQKGRMVSRIERSIKGFTRQMSKASFTMQDDEPIVADVKRGKDTFKEQFETAEQPVEYETAQPDAAPQGV